MQSNLSLDPHHLIACLLENLTFQPWETCLTRICSECYYKEYFLSSLLLSLCPSTHFSISSSICYLSLLTVTLMASPHIVYLHCCFLWAPACLRSSLLLQFAASNFRLTLMLHFMPGRTSFKSPPELSCNPPPILFLKHLLSRMHKRNRSRKAIDALKHSLYC